MNPLQMTGSAVLLVTWSLVEADNLAWWGSTWATMCDVDGQCVSFVPAAGVFLAAWLYLLSAALNLNQTYQE